MKTLKSKAIAYSYLSSLNILDDSFNDTDPKR